MFCQFCTQIFSGLFQLLHVFKNDVYGHGIFCGAYGPDVKMMNSQDIRNFHKMRFDVFHLDTPRNAIHNQADAFFEQSPGWE